MVVGTATERGFVVMDEFVVGELVVLQGDVGHDLSYLSRALGSRFRLHDRGETVGDSAEIGWNRLKGWEKVYFEVS